jgi:hypothetical protein
MGGLSFRFTVRSMMVWVALFALNLAGAGVTWRSVSKQRKPKVGIGPRVSQLVDQNADGNVRFEVGMLATGERLVRVVRPLQPPTATEVWSPFIATGSITLLVLLVRHAPLTSRRGAFWSSSGARHEIHVNWVELTAWWGTMAAALVGLNLAGAAYRPLPEAGERLPIDTVPLAGGITCDRVGDFLFRLGDGRLIFRNADGSRQRPATAVDFPLPLHRGAGQRIVLETIVYRSDGSVVAYDGNPGILRRIVTSPRVIERSPRSTLDIWWPVVASASISFAVLDIVYRGVRLRSSLAVASRLARSGQASAS